MTKIKRMRAMISVALACGFMLTTCTARAQVPIYTAGSYTDSNGNEHACYWIGTKRTDLPTPAEASNFFASAITVVNNTVYTAGKYTDSNLKDRVCYWIGTERTDLPTLDATAITVVNDTVYAAGRYTDGNGKDRPCYWTGTERTELPIPSGASGSTATAIAVVNNTVYTAGMYMDWYMDRYMVRHTDYRACYWIGTERTDLSIPKETSDLFVSAITVVNNTVYTAGGYVDSNGYERMCYWIGAERRDYRNVIQGASDFYASAITVANNTVYTAGWYMNSKGDSRVLCWGATLGSIPAGASSSIATAITAVSDTVYMAGGYTDSNSNVRACYWIGIGTERAERADLPIPKGASDSLAGAITVVAK